jgi:hypothetical protein
MKVFLLYRDRDFDPEAELPPSAELLTQDLGLDILFAAMAAGDRFLLQVATTAVLTSLDDVDAIRYRQDILADCLDRPAVVRELYALAGEALERARKEWWYSPRFPDSVLRRSVDLIDLFVGTLKRLRGIAEVERAGVRSEGFGRLFDEMADELDDRYLETVAGHLDRLRFPGGVVLSAELGSANRGVNYVLRRRVTKPTWRERIGLPEPGSYVYELPERDEAGAQALSELRGRGIALAADALGQSTDHILSYFTQLRAELGFYVGCLNVQELLAGKGEPTCRPEAVPTGEPALSERGLYDVALSLSMNGRLVGNDLDADGKRLIVITGANRGGKSTFLRSLGLAQLMMQAGMFVAAEVFRGDVRHGLFTHFRREEDVNLRSGKLDEELGRMSWIVDRVAPGSLVLFNESFASTNEREGSEIARQIVRALLEAGIKVGYVTHMFDLADGFHGERRPDALFLRAEWLPDGSRTFRIVEGEPLPTSHGIDVYRQVFGAEPGATA